jgi:twitching motility protein PilI
MTDAAHPFAILLDYAQRSVDNAKGLPAQADIKPYWSGIGFSLAGYRFVAPMGEVAEIIVPPPATRLPGVESWVKGVSNLRGRLLPIIDLEAFFGGTLAAGRQQQRILALEAGELYSGLMVNEVYGMQHFLEDSFSGDLPEGLDEIKPFLAGSYEQNGQKWTVFSPFKLAKNQKFMNAASA